jgi:hypothetical protein
MDVGRYERTGLLVDWRAAALTPTLQLTVRGLLGLSIGGTILALSLLVFVGWKPALATYFLVLVAIYSIMRMAVDRTSKSV